MKIWYQHGSEHSANLVMIGHFKNATEATRAKEIVDALTNQVAEDQAKGELVLGSPSIEAAQPQSFLAPNSTHLGPLRR